MKFVLTLAFTLLASNGLACSVPVFRYALEHWAADAYQIDIAPGGPLNAVEEALVKRLTDAKPTNIKVKVIAPTATATRLILKHPGSLGQPREVWSAPLTVANVEALLDSPMRQDIAAKLSAGDSAVWVLLECGDKAKDNAAVQLLEQQLVRLAETMELPKLDEQDIKNGLVSVPDEGLRLSFPVLRLARDNAAEQVLIHTLLATEPDLQKEREPIAFPIFGRGRVLYALVGKGIRADNLGEAAQFLIGSCSCQIKEQNPGVDLVMSADWQKLLKTDTLLDEALPKLSDIEGLKPILVPLPERPSKPIAALQSFTVSSAIRTSAIAISLLIVAVVGWGWQRAKRR